MQNCYVTQPNPQNLPMKSTFLRPLFPLVVSAFFVLACRQPSAPVHPHPPVPEDPITQVIIPGAYGVKGGDQVVDPSRQAGVLVSGKTFSYRILDPSSLTVVSMSGLPVGLKTGDKISVYYRFSKGGRTLESQVYENVEILMTNDKMAWMKHSDHIFFVIQLL